jgi:hemerythrin-like domain-containing protein
MNAMPVHPHPATPAKPVDDGFCALDQVHRETLRTLDELSSLVAAFELDGPTPEASAAAVRIAAFFSTTAREHHHDEERHVFPALLESGKPEVVEAVLRLQRDHDWLEEDWFDIAPGVLAIARGHRPDDLDALREGVSALAALSLDHIELEESFVYPQARRAMPETRRREMGREIAARRRAQRAARRNGG